MKGNEKTGLRRTFSRYKYRFFVIFSLSAIGIKRFILRDARNDEVQQSKVVQDDSGASTPRASCPIRAGRKQNSTEPTYVACYPGSGSELTLNLIEGFTGIRTISHGGRCDAPETPYDYVALKTHYPWHCRKEWQHGLLGRAVVLLRNPIDSFPSKATRQYEKDQQDIHRPHSTQAPEDYWVKWRDEKFKVQLKLWKELVHYWTHHYAAADRLVLPYEWLVAEDSGPTLLFQLAQFLNQTAGVTVAIHHLDDAKCLWQEMVAKDSSTRRSNIHRKKTYRPTFTPNQYNVLVRDLSHLAEQYENETLGRLFQDYTRSVEELRDLAVSPEPQVGESPKIAWLMSYPNSHNTDIRNLLQVTTNTTGATNYGHERITSLGRHTFNAPTSIPVFPGEMNGPFRICDELPLPRSGYVLTKTHCGINGCHDCNVAPLPLFQEECTSGTTTMGDRSKSVRVKYNADQVKGAVHLFLDPFKNIITRFRGDKRYPNTRQGFDNWCRDYDDRFVLKSKHLDRVPHEVLTSKVMCHTAFFKYVQWHNNAAKTIRRLKLPVHLLFAEDFSGAQFDATVTALLEFLELERVETGEPFSTLSSEDNYFTPTALLEIVQFLKEYASTEVWDILDRKYDFSTRWGQLHRLTNSSARSSKAGLPGLEH